MVFLWDGGWRIRVTGIQNVKFSMLFPYPPPPLLPTSFFQFLALVLGELNAPMAHRIKASPSWIPTIVYKNVSKVSLPFFHSSTLHIYKYMHMYKWEVLLALVIVDVAFFIMHIYHNYEPLMLLSFSFVPFWPSIALFYEPSKKIMQTHKFKGCGWCGSLNFLNTFMFLFCKGQKRRHF